MCSYSTTSDMAQRLRVACQAYYHGDPYQPCVRACRHRGGDESLLSLFCASKQDAHDMVRQRDVLHSDPEYIDEGTTTVTHTATPTQLPSARSTPVVVVPLPHEDTAPRPRHAETSTAHDKPDALVVATAQAANVMSDSAEALLQQPQQQQVCEVRDIEATKMQTPGNEPAALAATVDKLLEKLEQSAVKVVTLDDLQQQLTERFALRRDTSEETTKRGGGGGETVVERQELALHLYGLRRQVAQLRRLIDAQEAERAQEARVRHGKDACEQRGRTVRVEIVRAYEEPEPQPYVKRRPQTTRGDATTTTAAAAAAARASTRRDEYTSSTFLTSTTASTTSTSSSMPSSPLTTSAEDSVAELFWQRRAAALRQQKARQTTQSTTSPSSRSTYTSTDTSVT